jgi:hypothetical protein
MHVLTGMPTSTVDEQKDVSIWPSPTEVGKLLQSRTEGWDRDGWHQEVEATTHAGLDKAIHIRRLVTMIDEHDGTLPAFGPRAT